MRTNPRTTVTVIWFALLGAVVFYWFFAHSARPEDAGPAPAQLSFVLPLIGISGAVASVLLHRVLMRPFTSRDNRSTGAPASPNPALTQRYIAGHIITFAMAESCGVFALVLALVGGPMGIVQGMLLAAIVALVLLKPAPWSRG